MKTLFDNFNRIQKTARTEIKENEMGTHIKCTGKNADDCYECGQYFSLHSLHYDQSLKRKVTDISCSIGGNRQFDEDGNGI